MSDPTSSPVTPTLPPKNSLRTVTTRTSSRPSSSTSGARTRAPYSPVTIAIGASRARHGATTVPAGARDRGSGSHSARRAPSTHAKKPGAAPVAVVDVAVQLELEGPRHPDAVLVHREALVGLGFGERSVGRAGSTRRRRTRDGGRARRGTRPASRSTRVDDGPRLVRRVRAHARPRSNRLTPSGTTHSDGELGIPIEHAGHRVVEHRRRRSRPGTRRPGRAPRCRDRAARAASAGSWRRVGCAASAPARRGRWRGCSRSTG